MKTAAAYIRVSTDDQVEYSPDSQLKELKAYAARHGMVIDPAHIYTDAGISGRQAKKRPAFQRMIGAAKGKPSPFEVILVWKFSRFARNQEESILYKSLLRKECNVEVVSITEETGDSMFGGLIERIIEWMDEFYSVRLSEEVTAKMTYTAEKGVVQAVAPFGYSKKPDQPMVIVPEEARWVKYIFERYLAGDSMLGIAKALNANGVRTHRGNQFENRTVEYILHNPMYIGYTRWTPDGKSVGRRIYDDPKTIIAKGDFPPIISDDLFNAVAEKLKQQKAVRKKGGKPSDVMKHWLSGMVKCSSCGATLVYSNAHGGFQCHKYAHGFCAVSHYVSAKKLEEAVISAIEQVTVTADFVRDHTRVPEDPQTVDYGPMIARLEKMLERAKLAYTEGIDTIEEYSDNKKRIVREIDDLRSKEAEQQSSIVYQPAEKVQEKISGVATLLKGDYSMKEKHDAIAGIVENITFSRPDNSINISFRL